MDCFGDWVCGVVYCGLWIGGLVYGVCEAEGVCAVCDLPDYFGGGGFVFCFEDGVRKKKRELNAEGAAKRKSSHRGHRGSAPFDFAQGRQRAQRREPKSTARNGCAT